MASKNRKDFHYAEEHKKFLCENIQKYTYPQLAVEFNKAFNTDIKETTLASYCLKILKIKRNHPHKFPKGRREFNQVPIGYEVWNGHDVWVKVANEYHEGRTPSKQCNPNWKRKSYLVWEKEHGEVPKGHMLIFLDKNPRNCEIDNLYCTTRKINFMLGKNGWHFEDREMTLAAIKWCELFYALNERTQNNARG